MKDRFSNETYSMEQYIQSFANTHEYEVYAIIALLALAEGPFISMIGGVLLSLGNLSFFPLLAALMVGDAIGDTIWYYLGHRFGHRFVGRFGKYFGITESRIEKVKSAFHEYKNSILFLSKITNGLGLSLAVLFTAGLSKIPFPRFITINMLGQLVWSGMLIAVGYWFGNLYVEVNDVMGRVGLLIIFVLIIFALVHYSKYFLNKIKKV